MGCLILGDSIGIGIASVLKGCAVFAKIGASSAWILAHAHGGNYNTVYISSGSNDPYNSALYNNLINTKNKFPHSKIIWIAPVNIHAKNVVYSVSHGDKVVNFIPGRDRVHPKSYYNIVNQLR